MMQKEQIKSIAIGVLAVGIFALAYYSFIGSPANLSAKKATDIAIAYINSDLLVDGSKATIDGDISSQSGLYKFKLKVGEQSFDSFVTKDAKFLFPQVIEIKQATSTASSTAQTVKSDRPSAKLFVMSYCPFGLQAEKGFLPVYDAFKGVADIGIYFVDYAMHNKAEIDENLRQYCIEKEENDKFISYLNCFVAKGKAETCLAEAKIDGTKLSSCEKQTDQEFSIYKNFADKASWPSGQFPPFNVHKDLNTQYGVQGSPTLVINDKVVSVGRSPEEIKQALCNSFNTPPEQCLQKFSTITPSSGFGVGADTGSGDASCGQ